MARIKIDMPDNYLFSTVMDVRISDINYGNHLGNDSVLSFVHEARTRFFRQYGYTEMDVEGFGIIMTDSAVVYKAEGFHGDQIQIDITVGDFNKYGCDIFYLMTNRATAVEIAHVKTGIVFFDYDARKVVGLPEAFRANLLKEA
ncbi:thioesterase family protein [Marinobacterium sp. xm-a-152]|uniref:acyl-CoA thioesterase n=1 Tax=Marinobacterium sp. xm-a-152 TaxID=2497733 RepID=UPI00156939B4|nr:thioesterase family protein [Marinobacterium sp. xm-a-152]NRP15537.1 hypothetical protein [Marinobacterium sp. xm-a-152]